MAVRPTHRSHRPAADIRCHLSARQLHQGGFHLLEISQPAVSAQMRKLGWASMALPTPHFPEKKASGVRLTNLGSEVLKSAWQMLSVNDRMVAHLGNATGLSSSGLGLPTLSRAICCPRSSANCGAAMGMPGRKSVATVPMVCYSSIRCGYLDIAFAFGDKFSRRQHGRCGAFRPEELVWARSPTLQFRRENPVPLISSPEPVLRRPPCRGSAGPGPSGLSNRFFRI